MALHQIPEPLINQIEDMLKAKVVDFQFVSGGCINHGGRIATEDADFFVKWNSQSKFPGMFEVEAKGLVLLNAAKGVRVPRVNAIGEAGDIAFIIMEWLESSNKKPNYWEEFGRQLARQHKSTASSYGLDHDNYIGSLPQKNTEEKSWRDFFIQHRLLFQLKLAEKSGRISGTDLKKMEADFLALSRHIPEDKPCLLHGDMWGGNLITGPEGFPCLIDPAVYFGHREMDLAMSRLFGGFDEAFISAYKQECNLEPDWEARIDLWNLYPLMVHVNLFGGGYLGQVRQILKWYQ